MGRTKLKKFQQNQTDPFVFEPGKEDFPSLKGRWHTDIFKNNHPIVLELACGYGEYSTGLAAIYPEMNFVGVDIKGDRLWQGAQVAHQQGLTNVRFLRALVNHLDQHFAPNEVAQIWIINPDPRPKNRDRRRRLTDSRFLNLYKSIIRPDGIVRLKTDANALMSYTLEMLAAENLRFLDFTADLYRSKFYAQHHQIKTKYEQIFTQKGHSVSYCAFGWKEEKKAEKI